MPKARHPGDEARRDAYRIRAYPSYYVLGRDGQVRFASVGYSTLAGLLWRWFLA